MVDMFVLRESVGSLDYLIEGAIYAFIALTFYGVLILFYSFREQVFSEFNMKRSLFDRAKVTVIGLGLCFLIGIFAPNMTQAFGVIGGMFCTLMGWIIPFLIKIRMLQGQGYPWNHPKRLIYLIAFIFVIFISLASTVQSIFQL